MPLELRKGEKAWGEPQLQGLIERLPFGLVIYRGDGQLLLVNAIAEELLGDEASSSEGSSGEANTVEELLGFRPDKRGESAGYLSVREALVQYRLVELEAGSGSAAFAVYLEDARDLEKMAQERDRYMRLVGMNHLFPAIAHEVKNPLAGIQNMMEVLLEEPLDRRHKDDIEVMLEEVERLRFIVDGMGLSMLRVSTHPLRVDLARVARKTITLFRRRAEHLGLVLSYIGEERIEAAINADLVRLTLVNLLNNALAACEKGNAIWIDLRRRAASVRMTVEDTGRGMSGEQMQRATELFYSTKPSGSGIGLALINELARRCGGALEIDSEPGRGTRVHLDLPEGALR